MVSGTLSGPPILLGPLVKDGSPGYGLILALDRPNGTTILLNRGFITTTRATAIREGREMPPGISADGTGEQVTVEGMLLKPSEKGMFTQDNDIERNQWHIKSDLEYLSDIGHTLAQAPDLEQPASLYHLSTRWQCAHITFTTFVFEHLDTYRDHRWGRDWRHRNPPARRVVSPLLVQVKAASPLVPRAPT